MLPRLRALHWRMTIASTNPATGETFARFDALSDQELERRLALAERAFAGWRRQRPAARANVLEAAAAELTEQRRELARLATLEMGKLYTAALAEVDKCASCLRWYAENHERLLAVEEVKTDAQRSYVRFDPLGPVLAVMPWNFPYWQVVRFAAPALLAGNVGLLKHASNVPQVALALERVFLEAGLPEGGFQTLLVEAARVKNIVADRRVRAATLTGSEAAGASLAEHAGKNLKKTVLELGGSDPFVVLESAEVEKAAEVAVAARVQNNGQSCIAAKRFIVHERVAALFEAEMQKRMAALRVGDPIDDATEVGPLAMAQVRDDVEEQVKRTVAAGAEVLAGGKRLDGRGFFFAPTLLAGVPTSSAAAVEEVFGPVAAVFRVRSTDEAVRLANATRYGLGAAVFTTDQREQEKLAEEIEAGSVFFNGMVKSDPRLPFGGVKLSGYGRELSSHGMREFMNVKSVWIGAAGRPPIKASVE
jgi:succinate-semialdehyde dehydrogenase/glutarate-semialdehyde dehydrogenase